jgi:hypothetical protein
VYGKIGKPSTQNLIDESQRVLDVIQTITNSREDTELSKIVCLGKYAAVQLFFSHELRLAQKEGREFDIDNLRMKDCQRAAMRDLSLPLPAICIFHPSYILRKMSIGDESLWRPIADQYVQDLISIKDLL